MRGYQILGTRWLLGDEVVEGLSLIDIETLRPGKGFDRLIDNIMLSSSLASMPVVGYENHAGRTHLGEGVKPFGKVISSVGSGNNDSSKEDGVLYKNCIGTYLHGPLLGKILRLLISLLRVRLKIVLSKAKMKMFSNRFRRWMIPSKKQLMNIWPSV